MKVSYPSPRPARRTHDRSRRGVVLIAALVCLLVVMTMLGHLLLAMMQSGRQLHVERDLRQCELLLQAGIARAANRLEDDRAYPGETWELAPADLIDRGAGQVTITRETNENGSAARLLIVAEYPLGGERSVRRSHRIPASTDTTSPSEE